MIPRAVLITLSPLALASLALLAHEVRRGAPAPAPQPGLGTPIAPPPAFLLALSTAGRWRVVGDDSRLELRETARGGIRAAQALRVSGELVLEDGGLLADLDLEAQLDPAGARALLGAGSEGELTLRASAASGLASVVTGVRLAEPSAWLALDGLRRQLPLRATWMPCGPGLLRLQLEAGWGGDVGGDDDLVCSLVEGKRRSTLALDLVLARS